MVTQCHLSKSGNSHPGTPTPMALELNISYSRCFSLRFLWYRSRSVNVSSVRCGVLQIYDTHFGVAQHGVHVVDVQLRFANSILPVRIANIDRSVTVCIQIIDKSKFLFILIEFISWSGKSLYDDFFFDDAISVFIRRDAT